MKLVQDLKCRIVELAVALILLEVGGIGREKETRFRGDRTTR